MALNNFNCNSLMPLHFKALTEIISMLINTAKLQSKLFKHNGNWLSVSIAV